MSRLCSQPSPGSPLQLPSPGSHTSTPHTPPTQLGVPPVLSQMLPQVLQLLMSVSVLVSQPLVASLSQLS